MCWFHLGILSQTHAGTYSSDIDKTKLLGCETKNTSHYNRIVDLPMVILKCFDCGNTFELMKVKDGELVTCPVCEGNYEVSIKDGKAKLKECIYEEGDANEGL